MREADIFHLLNPNQRHRRAVEDLFHDKSLSSCAWVERSSHPTHLETLVEWALNQGRNRLAVWGGDGTFSRVVQALYTLKSLKSVTLILVPTGTCNDFVRKMGYSLKKAIKAMDSGLWQEIPIDLGLINCDSLSRIFVNNSGFGRTWQALFQPRSNPLSDILHFREHILQIEWEGEEERQFETYRAYLGIVFNAPYFSKGLHFDKGIDPVDGFLNAFFEPPQSRLKLLMKFLKGRLGKQMLDNKTLWMRSKFLSVNSNIEMFPQVDGEPLTQKGVKSLSYISLPGALRLQVPQEK